MLEMLPWVESGVPALWLPWMYRWWRCFDACAAGTRADAELTGGTRVDGHVWEGCWRAERSQAYSILRFLTRSNYILPYYIQR
jgi:hypothetical protein